MVIQILLFLIIGCKPATTITQDTRASTSSIPEAEQQNTLPSQIPATSTLSNQTPVVTTSTAPVQTPTAATSVTPNQIPETPQEENGYLRAVKCLFIICTIK